MSLQSLVSVPHSRAGEGVALGVVPLVEGNTSVGSLVNTRNFHGRAGLAGAGTLDLELEALNVD